MKIHTILFKDRFLLIITIISATVAALIHFPEMISLFDVYEQFSLFPGMQPQEVLFEIVFTFFSLLILFAANTLLFKFNQKNSRISPRQIIF